MRLFIGVALPVSLQAQAASAADDLRKRFVDAVPRVRLRWVDSTNLHITVWFLGEVAEARADELSAALGEPLHTSGFLLQIGGAGVFPVSGPPRALWLGVRAGDQSLSQLHQELGIRLARLGFPPDTRDYSAHLTVARFKDIRRRDGAAVRSLLGANTTVVGECTVTSVTLFRSHLSPKGSHYEHLLRVPLS